MTRRDAALRSQPRRSQRRALRSRGVTRRYGGVHYRRPLTVTKHVTAYLEEEAERLRHAVTSVYIVPLRAVTPCRYGR